MYQVSPELNKKIGKVAVLFGGFSAEREVSLRSGKAVCQALKNAGVDAHLVDPKDDSLLAITNGDFDRVWNALHGRKGEDGVIQGFLELHQIPYTGCGVMASSIAMDKLSTKLIWMALGLPVAKHEMVETGHLELSDAEKLLAGLNYKVMVKPIREGSSVGMAQAETAEQLVEAVTAAHQFDDEIMLEQWVDGEEFTVAILNGKALPSIRIHTPTTFYDYKAKYQSQTTEYFCPSGLTENEELELAELAEKAFKAIHCHGWARVDFLRDRHTRKWVLLEVNTVPGMTETSLVPKAAKATGMSFEELTVEVLKTSFVERR